MANTGQDKEESVGSLKENHFVNLERRRDGQHTPSIMMESYHTECTERNHSMFRSHTSHDLEKQKLQQEIDRLCSKLRHREHKRRNPPPSPSDGSRGSKDNSYHWKSGTPFSESYSASLNKDRWEKSSHDRKKRASHHGLRNDAISKALQQIFKSPFFRRINRARLPHWFSQPTFSIYNGRTDPIEHISHFNQKMAAHANNEALMCKVVPSNLGPMAMHWFDTLEEGLVGSFKELMRAFRARFITCSRVSKPIDYLLSMAMKEGETLKTYLDRYWETNNEINGNFEDMTMRTFKVELPAEHKLRKSLTMKSTLNKRQLMDRIDKYKQVKED